MFIKFQKVSDRKRTWIACIIYKIPQKNARVVKTSIYHITSLLFLIKCTLDDILFELTLMSYDCA